MSFPESVQREGFWENQSLPHTGGRYQLQGFRQPLNPLLFSILQNDKVSEILIKYPALNVVQINEEGILSQACGPGQEDQLRKLSELPGIVDMF